MGTQAGKPIRLTRGTAPGTQAPKPYIVVGGSGRVTLVGGTATVSAPGITANTNISLQIQALGTVTAPTPVAVTSRVVGTSFTITSASASDTSVISYSYDL